LEHPVICTTYAYFNQIMKDHNHCTMIKVLCQLHLIPTWLDLYTHYVALSSVTLWKQLLLQSREEDTNRDGKYDELYFEVQVHLQNQVPHSVTLFLIFDYRLYVCIEIKYLFCSPTWFLEHSSTCWKELLYLISAFQVYFTLVTSWVKWQ
jgi:hypothetical protein